VAEVQYLAEHIPGAKLVVMSGDDHLPWWGDQERLIGEIQEFLTGTRHAPPAERVLVTVVTTDIVGSTERAAEIGDQKWKDVLQQQDAIVRQELTSTARKSTQREMASFWPLAAQRALFNTRRRYGRAIMQSLSSSPAASSNSVLDDGSRCAFTRPGGKQKRFHQCS
jgi:class 3 adenylate cyclase